MYKQYTRNWIKHFDFMLIDVFCLQACFMLSYWLNVEFGNPYESDAYQYQAIVLTLSQFLIMLFSKNYRGILGRKRFDEFIAVFMFALGILAISVIYLFLVHHSGVASRLQFGFTLLSYLLLDYLLRQLNKRRVRHQQQTQLKSMVLITSSVLLEKACEQLSRESAYRDYFISEVLLFDESALSEIDGVPVIQLDDNSLSHLSRSWVDEVLILQPSGFALPRELIDGLTNMGITVNYCPPLLTEERWVAVDLREIGGYKVLTGGMRFATAGEVGLKRAMDFIGGAIGCVFTAVIFVFVAPAIYIKSPGPIFFTQERVGRNGRTFKMYKFRSMYLDAEERKAALLEQNKIKDGMMFKMADDPRVIGGEKKRRDGSPGGVGNFIRRTSLDEFPQFFNVLKGDMSLVGTRPPTLDEWNKYDLGHRVRMSMKPGITGLWQVSGRSQITDFDDVVRLDRDYIEGWTLALDAKILLKTVVVVLKRSGAE